MRSPPGSFPASGYVRALSQAGCMAVVIAGSCGTARMIAAADVPAKRCA
jgi:hypothetical protein